MRSIAARRQLAAASRNLAFSRDPSQADVLEVIKNLESIISEMMGKNCQLVAIFENEPQHEKPLTGQISLLDLLEQDNE